MCGKNVPLLMVMYRKLFFALALCAIILFSCTGNSKMDAVLDSVDSLMESDPDSALVLLERYKPVADSVPESSLMRYELLRAKAHNKLDIYFTSDSTMKNVVAWYEKNGTDDELMEALYLLGCVYRDLGDAPMALKYYKEATVLADTTVADCDWLTLCHIHGQMATLFHNMGSPEYELEELRLTETTSLRAKDTMNALMTYEFRVGAYYAMYNEDSVISITQKVRDKYLQYGRKDRAAGALHSAIFVYLNQEKFDKAKECMDEFEQNSGFFDANGNIRKRQELYYSPKARYYLGVNKIDSALIYLNKLLLFKDNIECAEAAYDGLMNLYMKLGKSDSVVKYAKLYCRMNDSSTIVRSSEEINRCQAIYNYDYANQQMKNKEREAERYRQMLIYGVLLVLVISFLSYRLYVSRKRKALAKNNREYSDLLQKYHHASDEFSRITSDMEKFKADKEKEIKELCQSISAYQEDMSNPEIFDLERNLRKCDIATRLHALASRGKESTTHEIDAITGLISSSLPDFHRAITAATAGLTDREILVCMLIRLGFIPSEIATLLDLSLQNITNIRSKINRKLFNADGTKSLDARLRRL